MAFPRPLAATDEEVAFWSRHARTGALLAASAVLLVIVYALLTPEGPHRGRIVGLATLLGGGALGALLAVPVERLARARVGALYFYGFELAGLAAVGRLAAWDGGDSPLLVLLFVLLAHGAVAYPTGGTMLTTGAAVGAWLWVAEGAALAWPERVTWSLGLAATALIAGHSARNHHASQDAEASRRRRIAAQARRDGLTGCLTHAAFHERLAREATVASLEAPLALVVVDVDGFKPYNDARGHLAGDAALATLGRTIRDLLRKDDVVGRVGGDEFAVALPNTRIDEAQRIAHRVLEAARALDPPLTLSVGLAMTCERSDPKELYGYADDALYDAKREGRDRVARHLSCW
ncbi:MAG: GGDEF domain-containing protein [Egibacteraceae bacterium]